MNSFSMQTSLVVVILMVTIAAAFYDSEDVNFAMYDEDGMDRGELNEDDYYEQLEESPISDVESFAKRLIKRWTYNCVNDLCITRCQTLMKAKTGFCAENGKCHCIGKPKKNKKIPKLQKRSFLQDEDGYLY